VAAWVAEGKETGEDGDIDEDVVRIGEENFDRFGTWFDEDDIIPMIFKVLNEKLNGNNVDWTAVRAAIMGISQVVEHLEDDNRVDQCIGFVMRWAEHPHPRVRYVFFSTIAQCCYDQSDRVQEKYVDDIMPKILKGLQDDNIRVVIAAAEAFSSLGDEMEDDEMKEYLKELLDLLFRHLDKGESRFLQEKCIECVAVAAEAAENEFIPYYGEVMPMLKQVIQTNKEELTILRGKAFECASEIGRAVGKDMFVKDACEIFEMIVPMFQAGFAADDKARDHLHSACENIVEVIGKDFKSYVGVLLPSIFAVLKQTPKDITEVLGDEDDADLDNWILNDLGALALKTSVVEEMDDNLELMRSLIKSLEEEFSDFIGPSCEVLLPLLDYPFSEDVRETLYKVWSELTALARSCAQNNRLAPAVLSGLVSEFLKKTVGDMGKGNPKDVVEQNLCTCARYQTLATGAADVIRNAGLGALPCDAMTDVAKVVGQLLAQIEVSTDTVADGKQRKKKDPEALDDDDEELLEALEKADKEDDFRPHRQCVFH